MRRDSALFVVAVTGRTGSLSSQSPYLLASSPGSVRGDDSAPGSLSHEGGEGKEAGEGKGRAWPGQRRREGSEEEGG